MCSASQLIEQVDVTQEILPTIMTRGLKSRLAENSAEELATIKSYQGGSKKFYLRFETKS